VERAIGVQAAEGAFGAFGFVAFIDVAASAIGPGGETRCTLALEATNNVVAGSIPTNVALEAFIVINAIAATAIQDVADGTFAPEGAVRVDTSATFVVDSRIKMKR
jgi:hypothetical protein